MQPADDNKAEQSPPETAILSIIAVISMDNFWMSSDAEWRGSTSFTKTLADAKVLCVLVKNLS